MQQQNTGEYETEVTKNTLCCTNLKHYIANILLSQMHVPLAVISQE